MRDSGRREFEPVAGRPADPAGRPAEERAALLGAIAACCCPDADLGAVVVALEAGERGVADGARHGEPAATRERVSVQKGKDA